MVQLRPGDLIIAYTDGVTEAVNPAGEDWGVEGLRKAADESAAQCPDDIARATSHRWMNSHKDARPMTPLS